MDYRRESISVRSSVHLDPLISSMNCTPFIIQLTHPANSQVSSIRVSNLLSRIFPLPKAHPYSVWSSVAIHTSVEVCPRLQCEASFLCTALLHRLLVGVVHFE